MACSFSLAVLHPGLTASWMQARKGLGGAQGIGLALGLIALVGAATVFVGASGGGNELEATGEPLSAIAARIQASL